MKPLLERDVDRLLHRQCELRKIECIKVASISNRGLPDRMLIGPGRLFGFVEVKRANGNPTSLQIRMNAKLSGAGVWCRFLWGGIDRASTLARVEQLICDYLERESDALHT